MMIPVRCMTCGRPIGHLWEEFNERIESGEDPKDVLDSLGLKDYCCRTTFLTHIDMIDKVKRFKR